MDSTDITARPEGKLLVFERQTTVKASQEAVARFHSNKEGFKALIPPLMPYKIHRAAEPLGEGDNLDFTLWLGPIPVYWESVIHDVSESGFKDTQDAGPFEFWQHTHHFEVIDEGATRLTDRIEARFSRKPFKALVCLMMWTGLPVLFMWRHFSTRRSLEKG